MKKLFVSLVIIALVASYANAGNVQTFGVGAKNSAQAEAVVAHANGPFAVYYNPAGLTLTEDPTISFGATVFDAVVKVSEFSITSDEYSGVEYGKPFATDFETNNDLIINPTIGFATPITDKLSFGIAAYAPYGLHIEWDKDPVKNPGAYYAWESKYVREVISPTLGYKFSDILSMGIGISLGRSICDSGKILPFKLDPTTGIASPITAPNDGSKLAMELEDSFNVSANVGIMFSPTDTLSLGFTYRGETDADFKGDILIDDVKVGTATMDYDHPESVQVGVRYFFTDTFSMEVDATWTRWGIIDQQVEKISSTTLAPYYGATSDFEVSHNRAWDNTIQYKIGTEWKVFSNFTLRAGYTYDPTPVPDETFDMGWPDTDRSVYNLGFGWGISENWTIDAVVQHVRSTSRRNISGNSEDLNEAYGPLVEGAYANTPVAPSSESVNVSMQDEGILWGYGINISYRF